jgi:cytochrome c peroxidase
LAGDKPNNTISNIETPKQNGDNPKQNWDAQKLNRDAPKQNVDTLKQNGQNGEATKEVKEKAHEHKFKTPNKRNMSDDNSSISSVSDQEDGKISH